MVEIAGVAAGTLGAIAAGGATFWGLAWLLGSEEARSFTRLVLQRIGLQGA
jgi:hypothetical protein